MSRPGTRSALGLLAFCLALPTHLDAQTTDRFKSIAAHTDSAERKFAWPATPVLNADKAVEGQLTDISITLTRAHDRAGNLIINYVGTYSISNATENTRAGGAYITIDLLDDQGNVVILDAIHQPLFRKCTTPAARTFPFQRGTLRDNRFDIITQAKGTVVYTGGDEAKC